MRDKVKKFDAGGSILDQSNIAGQIFAQQPSGIGSAGTPLDLSSIQQSYASTFPMDLDYMDMLEEAADKEEFRMLGVTDAPPFGQRQIEAAQDYIDDLSRYISSANSENKQALDDAKQKLVELNVSREQIESVTNFRFPEGIDASKGIEGVMGPSIGGVASQIGQGALDLIGATGQTFSDIVTLGTGPEVAQTLLDPVSILLGGLGGTINYGQSGTTTPLIVGKTTKTGMPVGINIPDPRSILEGGLGTLIPGAAGVAGAAGVLNTLGNQDPQDPSDGVGVTPAAVLTAAAAADDDDPNKLGDPNGDSNSSGNNTVDNSSGSDVVKTTDPNGEIITVDEGPAIGPQLPTKFDGAGDIITKVGPGLLMPTGDNDDDDDEEIIETILTDGEEPPYVPPEEPPYVPPEKLTPPPPKETTPPPEPPPESLPPTGGGGGTFTLPPSVTTVREEPGELVDIDYLYDFARGLDQPFVTTQEDETMKDLYLYAEGGDVNNPDAVEMATRRPGEYGRRYFTDGVFTPTGTALGGSALDPNAIQIPQYTYQRDLISPQSVPSASAAPMDAISYTTAPSEDADIDVDTLLELVGLIGMEGLGFAAGGMASLNGRGRGYYLGGPTDGMADLVPATIDGAQPAALSDGEFVIPADVVSHLGNGNSDAGAKQLYSMMDRVRDERTGTTKQGPEINPTKMMPA